MDFDFILACGDSYTEGCQNIVGLGPEGTWPGLLAKKYNVPFANLASGGSSNTLISLQPVNTPHGKIENGSAVEWNGLENAKKPLIIFGFTVLDRWTYFDGDMGRITSHFSIDPEYMSKTDNHGNDWTDWQKDIPLQNMHRKHNFYNGKLLENYTWATVQAINLAMQYEQLIPGATVMWGFIHERHGADSFGENIFTLIDKLSDPYEVTHGVMEWPSIHRCFNKAYDWKPLQRMFDKKKQYWLRPEINDHHPNLEGIELIAETIDTAIQGVFDV